MHFTCIAVEYWQSHPIYRCRVVQLKSALRMNPRPSAIAYCAVLVRYSTHSTNQSIFYAFYSFNYLFLFILLIIQFLIILLILYFHHYLNFICCFYLLLINNILAKYEWSLFIHPYTHSLICSFLWNAPNTKIMDYPY